MKVLGIEWLGVNITSGHKLLEAARLYALDAASVAAKAKNRLQQRFGVEPLDLEPRVFYRLTDNWLELSVRFVLGTTKSGRPRMR